jgi:hypothetical protein
MDSYPYTSTPLYAFMMAQGRDLLYFCSVQFTARWMRAQGKAYFHILEPLRWLYSVNCKEISLTLFKQQQCVYWRGWIVYECSARSSSKFLLAKRSVFCLPDNPFGRQPLTLRPKLSYLYITCNARHLTLTAFFFKVKSTSRESQLHSVTTIIFSLWQ